MEELEELEELETLEELEIVQEPQFNFFNLSEQFKCLKNSRSKNVKVIFLDVDGVLNYEKWRKHQLCSAGKNIVPIDEKKVKIISNIIKKTQAKVVFSSSWRFIIRPENAQFNNKKSRVYKVKRLFNKYHIRIADATGADFVSPDKSIFGRGYEIQSYLDKHPEIKNYVIIDDAEKELQNFKGSSHLFLTYYEKEGITESQGKEIISFLNKYQPAFD